MIYFNLCIISMLHWVSYAYAVRKRDKGTTYSIDMLRTQCFTHTFFCRQFYSSHSTVLSRYTNLCVYVNFWWPQQYFFQWLCSNIDKLNCFFRIWVSRRLFLFFMNNIHTRFDDSQIITQQWKNKAFTFVFKTHFNTFAIVYDILTDDMNFL